MKKKNGKYCFWQTPVLAVIVIFGIIICTSAVIGSIVDIGIREYSNLTIIVIVASLFLIFLLSVGIRLMLLRIEINSEKIIVRWLFGKLTECNINEIKEVSIRQSHGTGTFIIIKDSRERQWYHFFQKNGYVAFHYTKKRAMLVRTFWKDEIKFIPAQSN